MPHKRLSAYLGQLDYRYHFQDPAGRLIFRYDSTPHFPGLAHFPHHRHQASGVEGCNTRLGRRLARGTESSFRLIHCLAQDERMMPVLAVSLVPKAVGRVSAA